MKLQPRHLVLLAVVLSFFAYRMIQHRRAAPRDTMTIVTTPHPTIGPRQDSPAWSAFDHAAGLRDAAAAQFDPALDALNTAIQANKPPADLDGCKTWLLFYRQSVLHPERESAWHARSAPHLDSCVQNHADVAL